MPFKETYNLQFLTDKPETGVQVKELTGVELLALKAGKRKWTIGNLELREGLPLLIFSPCSQKYWYRILRTDHDINLYTKYIKDGNLYILFNDEWKEKVVKERESECMTYRDYNHKRHLIILDELLERKGDRSSGYQSKKRAIQIELLKIKQKYK